MILYIVPKSLGIDVNVLPVIINDDDKSQGLSDGSSVEEADYTYKSYYTHKNVHVGYYLATSFNAHNNYEDPLSQVSDKGLFLEGYVADIRC